MSCGVIDLQAETSAWGLRSVGACVSGCTWYNDLGHCRRGRRLGCYLGFCCLLRGPGRESAPKWHIADCALTVHVVEPSRTPIPPCVRILDLPSCAGLFRRNSSLSPSRRQNRAPLKNHIRKFSTPPRIGMRLTEPVCVNGSHLRHVLLRSEDKFVIDDICRGVCWGVTLRDKKR